MWAFVVDHKKVLCRACNEEMLRIQELDEYESYYRSRLTREGYSSVYIQRSGRKRDGCGIFFKRNRCVCGESHYEDYCLNLRTHWHFSRMFLSAIFCFFILFSFLFFPTVVAGHSWFL